MWKRSVIGGFMLLSLCALGVTLCDAEEGRMRLSSMRLGAAQVTKAGYSYLVFGNQVTNGIAAYDIRRDCFTQLLTPPDKRSRYRDPCVGPSGVGYCIREPLLASERKTGEIVRFDLRTLSSSSVLGAENRRYFKVALSHDEGLLALLAGGEQSLSPAIEILDLRSGRQRNSFGLPRGLGTDSVHMHWTAEDKMLVIWDGASNDPALAFDASSGLSRTIEGYPFSETLSCSVVADSERRSISLVEISTGKERRIISDNATAHAVLLTPNCDYVGFAWLRRHGFAALAIMKAGTNEIFFVDVQDHSGTVLGLALW